MDEINEELKSILGEGVAELREGDETEYKLHIFNDDTPVAIIEQAADIVSEFIPMFWDWDKLKKVKDGR